MVLLIGQNYDYCLLALSSKSSLLASPVEKFCQRVVYCTNKKVSSVNVHFSIYCACSLVRHTYIIRNFVSAMINKLWRFMPPYGRYRQESQLCDRWGGRLGTWTTGDVGQGTQCTAWTVTVRFSSVCDTESYCGANRCVIFHREVIFSIFRYREYFSRSLTYYCDITYSLFDRYVCYLSLWGIFQFQNG
jgi:hypothetical protein